MPCRMSNQSKLKNQQTYTRGKDLMQSSWSTGIGTRSTCLQRRQRNSIGKLNNGEWPWVEDEVEKEVFISNYFLQLFRSSAQGDAQQRLHTDQPYVTEEMNEKNDGRVHL